MYPSLKRKENNTPHIIYSQFNTSHNVKELLWTSESQLHCTFPADAGAVDRRAGCVIMAGAGGHAAWSV